MDLRKVVGCAGLGVMVASYNPAQAAPQFGATRILPAVFMVGADLATGDLNRDGIADLTQSNPGFAIGTNLLDFRAKLVTHEGLQLADAAGSVPAGPPSLSSSVRVATGDFDEDGWEDVISLPLNLTIGLSLNRGQSTIHDGFVSGIAIDDLTQYFQLPWPTILYVPVFKVHDFDADGHLDLLVVPMLAHYLSQTVTSPGLFMLYGNGDGTFQPIDQTPTSEAIIDADWVDWDGDGVAETLLAVSQLNPNPTSYTTWLTRYRFDNRTTAQIGVTQSTGVPLFITSLVHVANQPQMGGMHAVFLTGHTNPVQWSMQPGMAVIEMSPQGAVTSTNYATLPNSLLTPTIGDLLAAQAGDFNGDGAQDVVCLYSQKQVAPGSVVMLHGPLDSLGSHSGVTIHALNAWVEDRNNPPRQGPNYMPTWSPHLGFPDALAVVDFNLDQAPDLAIGGLSLYSNNTTVQVSATIMNSMPVTYQGSVATVGPARRTLLGVSAVAGTSGGHPVAGNADFSIRLGNGPKNALCALMAGTVQANFVHYGLPFVFAPDQFSALAVVSGTAEGSTHAGYALPIPNSPAVVSMLAYFQWMICDLNAAVYDPLPLYPSSTIAVEFGFSR